MKSSRVTFWSLLFAVFCLLGVTDIAHAQFNAAIQGTVTDPTGAIVPGATITATNEATNVPYTAQSTGSGTYRISGLPPGLYSVTTEAPSFSAHTDKDVRVAAEQPRGLDLPLAPAAAPLPSPSPPRTPSSCRPRTPTSKAISPPPRYRTCPSSAATPMNCSALPPASMAPAPAPPTAAP